MGKFSKGRAAGARLIVICSKAKAPVQIRRSADTQTPCGRLSCILAKWAAVMRRRRNFFGNGRISLAITGRLCYDILCGLIESP